MNPFFSNFPSKPHLTRPRGLAGMLGELGAKLEASFDLVSSAVGGSKGRDLLWSNQPGADATTWTDVMNIVALAPSGTRVISQFVGVGDMTIEPAGTYDFKHGTIKGAFVGTNSSGIDVADGVVLKNVNYIFSSMLHFYGTGAPSFILETDGGGSPAVLFCMFGGGIQNEGTAPIFEVETGEFFIIGGMLGAGGIRTSGAPAVRLKPGSILLGIALGNTTAQSPIDNNTVISDDNTSIVGIAHDGWFNGFPSLPSFTGTLLNIALTQNGGSGPTAARPAPAFGPLNPGTFYWDTDVGKPIVWSGSGWQDYAGNPV